MTAKTAHFHLTLLFLNFFCFLSGSAQDLKSHQWKDRLVLIISNGKDEATFSKQITLLTQESGGIEERKIKLYQITPATYCIGLATCKTFDSKKLFVKYSRPEIPFKIILIGLDGKIKLQGEAPINASDLFTLIDKMPMRKKALVEGINLED